MKFQSYLDEQKPYWHTQKTVDELASLLDKKCKPWFKEISNYDEAGNPVYRGVKESIGRGVKESIGTFRVKKGTRTKDREPKLTQKEVFEIFDKAFAEEFGWWVRSRGIFTADRQMTHAYGNPYMFFPIGQYKYVWSFNFRKVWHNLTNPGTWGQMSDEQRELHLDDQKDTAEEVVKLYNDNNIKRAVRMLRDYEAIFQCKSYVLVEDELANLTLKQMFG
jgi:hypothetical protein